MHMLSRFSHVQLFAMLWTVAHQAPLSMGFSRQEYWNGLPFPPPGDLPRNWTCVSYLLHWQMCSLPLAPLGSHLVYLHTHCINKVDKEVMPCPNVCICLQGLQYTLWLRFSEDRWLGLPPLRGFPFLIPLADPPSPSSNTQITSLAQSSRVIITLYLP